MAKIGSLVVDLRANVEKFHAELGKAQASMKSLENNVKHLEKTVKSQSLSFSKLFGSFAGADIAVNALRSAAQSLTSAFSNVASEAYTALQTFEMSSVSLKAMLAQQYKFADNIEGQFKAAGEAADELLDYLMVLDRQTVGSMESLMLGLQVALGQGAGKMTKNLKEVADLTSVLVNASGMYSKQQNENLAVQTNMKAMVGGQALAMSEVFQITGMTGEEWKKIRKSAEEQKNLLEIIQKLFPGVNRLAGELGNTSQALESTWKTLKMMFYREAFSDVFQNLKDSAIELREEIDANWAKVVTFAKSLGSLAQAIVDFGKSIAGIGKQFAFFDKLQTTIWLSVIAVKVLDKAIVGMADNLKTLAELGPNKGLAAIMAREWKIAFEAGQDVGKNPPAGVPYQEAAFHAAMRSTAIGRIFKEVTDEITMEMVKANLSMSQNMGEFEKIIASWEALFNKPVADPENDPMQKILERYDPAKVGSAWADSFKMATAAFGTAQEEVNATTRAFVESYQRNRDELDDLAKDIQRHWDDIGSAAENARANLREDILTYGRKPIAGESFVPEHDYENTVAVLRKTKEEMTGVGTLWSQQISTIFTDLSRNLADSLVELRGWKETGISVMKDFAKGALRVLMEGFFAKLHGALSGKGGAGSMLGGLGNLFAGIGGAALSFIPGIGPFLGAGFGALFGKLFSGGNKPMRMAGGGIVQEPAWGITRSGQQFTMAENGAEAVVPLKKTFQDHFATQQQPRLVKPEKVTVDAPEREPLRNELRDYFKAQPRPQEVKPEKVTVPTVNPRAVETRNYRPDKTRKTRVTAVVSGREEMGGVAQQLEQLIGLLSAWEPGSGDELVLKATRSPRVRRGVGVSVFSEPIAGF